MTDECNRAAAIQAVLEAAKKAREANGHDLHGPAPTPLHTRPVEPTPPPPVVETEHYVDGVQIGIDAEGKPIYGRRHKSRIPGQYK
jgi:hypothetical protein